MQVDVSGQWRVHLKTSLCMLAKGLMEQTASLQVVITVICKMETELGSAVPAAEIASWQYVLAFRKDEYIH